MGVLKLPLSTGVMGGFADMLVRALYSTYIQVCQPVVIDLAEVGRKDQLW